MYITAKQIKKLGQSANKVLAAIGAIDENQPIMLDKIVDLLTNNEINLLIGLSDANSYLIQQYFLKLTLIIEPLLTDNSQEALNVFKKYAMRDATVTIKDVELAVICAMRESFKYPTKAIPLLVNEAHYDAQKYRAYYAASAHSEAIYAVYLLARIFVKLIGTQNFTAPEIYGIAQATTGVFDTSFSSLAQAIAQARAFKSVQHFTHLDNGRQSDIYLSALNTCLGDQLVYTAIFDPAVTQVFTPQAGI
jgi:hypothetical protein